MRDTTKPKTATKAARSASRSKAGSFRPFDGIANVSERQRQIYHEASRLFVEKGFDATSMSDIAEAVKLTKAGVYHFIENKEALLFDIIQFGMDQLFADVAVPARMVRDPLDRLKLIIRNHLLNIGRMDTRLGNPVTIVVNETAGLSPQKRKIIDMRKREYFELVRDTLRELKQEGMLAPGIDPSIATHSLLGMILWMARWRRPNGKASLEEIIAQITQVAMGGILDPRRLR